VSLPVRALALTLVCAALPLAADPARLSGHGGPVMDVAVSPGGHVATASFDNAVGLWSGDGPRWLDGHAAAVNAVLFPGASAVFSGGDDFAVRQWTPETGASQVLGQHRGKVSALALSPTVPLLASASWDGTVALWKIAAVGATQPSQGDDAIVLRGHDQGVNDVAFSADGTTLYTASADGTIRAWDPGTGAETRVIARHGFGVNRLVLGPGWLAYGAVDGGTRLVSPLTGELLADFTAERRPILSLAYSDAAGLLAVGDGEGFIMVIDTATRGVAHDFRAVSRGPVWALAFSPDGSRLYSGGLDPDLLVWEVAELEEAVPATTAERASFLRDPETMSNGERQFMRKCSICHSLTPDTARKAGPTLHGVFGRRAGTVPGYVYSERLDGSDITWTPDTIDALFDQGPDHYIPGSKMPMQVIAKPGDRADLIAWLQTATATPDQGDQP